MAIAAALGSIVSGVTGMMQASYQAEVAKMNEDTAKWNAERARTRAGIDAQEKDVFETRALLGEQETTQAASGVSLAGKSQIATRNTARFLGRRDASNIIEEGQLESHNYKVQAANFKAEAKAAKISGISSLIGGVLGAASSLSPSMLGGASATPAAVASKYPPKPVLKPQPFKPAGAPAARTPLTKGKSPMGFTYPSFNLMKRRFGH